MKVTVLHTTNTRNASFNSLGETVTDLLSGKFYVAGEVEVGDGNEYDEDALDSAWVLSQNDSHPNPISPETGNPLPARWNGEFAQRSSMVGDALLVNNKVYVVANFGFEELNPVGQINADSARALSTAENFWKDKDDGWPEDGIVFNSEFDALMTG